MSARQDVLDRLDAWLSDERQVDDKLAQIRNLICDVVWAGDDLCSQADADPSTDPQYAQAWHQIGGQRALDAFDALSRDIADLLERA